MTPVENPRIDAHAYVFPDYIGDFLPAKSHLGFQLLKSQGRRLARPLANLLHKTQLFTRLLPARGRAGFEEIGSFVPLANLLIQSTAEDYVAELDEHQMTAGFAVAHPPYIPNDFVLSAKSDRIHPVAFAERLGADGAMELERFKKRGAVAIKIHPAALGLDPVREFAQYEPLLVKAAALELPVMLHTGCFSSHLLLKSPEYGDCTLFEDWLSRHPDLPFVLCHTNGPEPMKGIEFAKKHPNALVETSWQPAEILGECVRKLGADRVLFGSDWPLLGDNLAIGLGAVENCVKKADFSAKEAEFVLGKNAVRIFKL